MTEIIRKTPNGAILYDNSIIDDVTDDLFVPESWQEVNLMPSEMGGRGAIYILKDHQKSFVLRHFLRGGLIKNISSDLYIWLGENQTRSFNEWRVNKKLLEFDLPVPIPIAAQYIKQGLFYKAKIITQEIPAIKPLSFFITSGNISDDFWFKIGKHIKRFHKVGLYHADLNAQNIHIDNEDKIWLLDFDKSRFLKPGRWCEDNLKRLERSLNKVLINNTGTHMKQSDWDALKKGYSHNFKSS
ncbi:3-deoxy-D-manno-octulosonic acid kinase [bacterium]|nr:3-deoxy-D-manno-octulosonic acid kinase [bacterium]